MGKRRKIDPLIKKIKSECEFEGLRVYLVKSDHVDADGIPCSGYFSDSAGILAVALDIPNSRDIMVHEYCHFLQFKEKCKEWTDLEAQEPFIIDNWLKGDSNIDEDKLDKALEATMLLELDCEKRAVAFMAQNGLEKDIEQYIKQANAYVLSYKIVRKLRRWNKPGKAPYHNKSLTELMPNQFIDIDYVLTQEQENAFLESYI